MILKQRPLQILVVLFNGSFAAIAAQLIFIRLTEKLLHNEVLSYSTILFFHFFALALSAKKDSRQSILRIQMALGLLTPLFIFVAQWQASLQVLLHLLSPTDSYVLNPLDVAKCVSLNLIFVFILGLGHGFELPALFRKYHLTLGHSLFSSYLGALAAYVLVPFFFIPKFGVIATATMITALYILNTIILAESRFHKLVAAALIAAISSGVFIFDKQFDSKRRALFYADGITHWPEEGFSNWKSAVQYVDSSVRVFAIDSPIQSIEWVTYKDTQPPSYRLFLNGEFQFDSLDEKNYHSRFLLPLSASAKSLLIVGAGDGLLARQVLKDFPAIEKIDWVEVDPEMIELASRDPDLSRINEGSTQNPKVNIVIGDAFFEIKKCHGQYDAILLDLPYPSSLALSRVYSREFYSQLRNCLSNDNASLIFDAPTDPATGAILQATLRAANFAEVFAFGSGNTFFYASPSLQAETRKLIENSKIPILDFQTTTLVNELARPRLPLLF